MSKAGLTIVVSELLLERHIHHFVDKFKNQNMLSSFLNMSLMKRVIVHVIPQTHCYSEVILTVLINTQSKSLTKRTCIGYMQK